MRILDLAMSRAPVLQNVIRSTLSSFTGVIVSVIEQQLKCKHFSYFTMFTTAGTVYCRAFPRTGRRGLSQFVHGVRHLQKLKDEPKYCRDSWARGIFAVFYNLRPLLSLSEERKSWGITWKSADELAEIVEDFSVEDSVVLNCNSSDPDGPPKFAVNTAATTQQDHKRHLEKAVGGMVVDARKALVVVSKMDANILFQSLPLLQWHSSHQFCSRCGGRTVKNAAGSKRTCQSCNEIHYPMLHPVAMVLVTNGDRCLVVRQPGFMEGMYSAVSGFCEPGETLDAAVKREVAEEVGLEVEEVKFFSSQGWLYPKGSLMLGCYASLKAGTTDRVSLDKVELEDSRWLTRDEVLAILESGSPPGENLWLPPSLALPNHLLKMWASEKN